MSGKLITLALCSLLCGGCSSVGDFCSSDDDCGQGLRCTAQAGARGVCTYPEGLPDSAPRSDSAPDAALDDMAPDQAPDALSPDAGRDASLADSPLPDLAAPDQS